MSIDIFVVEDVSLQAISALHTVGKVNDASTIGPPIT